MNAVIYTVTDPSQSQTLTAFASTDSSLSISYSLAFANGTAINTAIMSLTDNTITTQTDDLSLIGTYLMTLTGYYTHYPTHQASCQFKIVFLDYCLRNVIKAPTYNFDFTYLVADPATVITLPLWTYNISSCAPITYQLLTPNLPSFIVVDIPSLSISVQTNEPATVGKYQVAIGGTTRNYCESLS